MKYLYQFLILLLLTIIESCDTIGRKPYSPGAPAPEILTIEMNIPDDATLYADVTFQIAGGEKPYTIYKGIKQSLDTLDAEQCIYKLNKIEPGLRPYVLTVRDFNYKLATLEINFLLPEVKAEGLYKDSEGNITTVNYKFKNFGSEVTPFYVLTENVYSNVYSYGNNKEVVGEVIQPDGFSGKKEYSIYTFEQAFGLEPSEYDDPSEDDFYHPATGSVYNGRNQGICPKYWHIPTNDEYLKLLNCLGISVNYGPNASLSSPVFNYRYINTAEEQLIFEKDFNFGYSYSDYSFPTWTKPGIGFWTSSMSADYSQYILYTRYNEGNTSLEAWGQNTGRADYREHIRCVFDF